MKFSILLSCLVTIGLANALSKLVTLPEPNPAFGDQASPKGERFDFGGKMKLLNISSPSHPNTFTMVDDQDYEQFNKFKWYARIIRNEATPYVMRGVREGPKQITIFLHREIMNPPKEMVVDHIDGDGLNNQRSNIRICTRQQNAMNMRKCRLLKTSRFKGVNKSGSKYVAKIKSNKKVMHLGTFENEIDAALAYNAKAIELFGEFANLNVIYDATTPALGEK